MERHKWSLLDICERCSLEKKKYNDPKRFIYTILFG
jgi:hypothetical protein